MTCEVAAHAHHAGQLLREWRARRNLSQFQLASGAAVSTRHLSFIETGRARPSREMVLHLADRLDVPLRERNRLLVAAGFAPAYGERALDSDEMAPVRQALERFLAAHEPYPALVLDRHWNLLLANTALAPLLEGVAPELLAPPTNALRATLHPDGMASRILNFDEWSAHLVHRLRREIALTGDPEQEALLGEVLAYPGRARRAAGGRRSRRRRDRAPPAASARERAPVVLQHADHVRHRSGRDTGRAGSRGVLPRRCGNGGCVGG